MARQAHLLQCILRFPLDLVYCLGSLISPLWKQHYHLLLLQGITQPTPLHLRWKCVNWSVNQLMYSATSDLCDWFRNGTQSQPSNAMCQSLIHKRVQFRCPLLPQGRHFFENGANPKDALGKWRQWSHCASTVLWNLSQWVSAQAGVSWLSSCNMQKRQRWSALS